MVTLKRPKIGFQTQLSLNEGQKIEHSAILLSFIKLPFVIKIFGLSIFEWPFYTSSNVPNFNLNHFHEINQSRLLTMFLLQKWPKLFR